MDFLFRESPVDVEVRAEIDEVLDDLEDTEDRASDLRLAFRVFDRHVSLFARQQFATAGAHGSIPWKPVLAETIERRAQNRGGAAHPLWDTGELRASLVETGPRSIRVIGRHRYVRGSLVGYAGLVGGPDTDRPIFPDPLPRELTDKAEETVSDYMARQGVFAGFTD